MCPSSECSAPVYMHPPNPLASVPQSGAQCLLYPSSVVSMEDQKYDGLEDFVDYLLSDDSEVIDTGCVTDPDDDSCDNISPPSLQFPVPNVGQIMANEPKQIYSCDQVQQHQVEPSQQKRRQDNGPGDVHEFPSAKRTKFEHCSTATTMHMHMQSAAIEIPPTLVTSQTPDLPMSAVQLSVGAVPSVGQLCFTKHQPPKAVMATTAPAAPTPPFAAALKDNCVKPRKVSEKGKSEDAVMLERRRRNREHAKRSRVRKKLQMNTLQGEMNKLQMENRVLRAAIKQHFPQDAERLIAECCPYPSTDNDDEEASFVSSETKTQSEEQEQVEHDTKKQQEAKSRVDDLFLEVAA